MLYKSFEEIQEAREVISPPGDTLLTILEERSISQVDLALRMNKHKKTINEIIKGIAPITPDTAIELERTLGVPSEFWIEREKRFRLQLAEINEAEKLLKDKEWIKSFPLSEMKKLGMIEFDNDPYSKISSLLNFFGVTSKVAYEQYYNRLNVHFRMSKKTNINSDALRSWLRSGDLKARETHVNTYSEKKLKESIVAFTEIMITKEANFFNDLQSLCGECGISLVYTPNLPKAPISGSVRWYRDRPLIQLSNRYKRNDIFWFTFFHELGHILKHGKKDFFIEGVEYSDEGEIKEKEADQFASECLLSKHDMDVILKSSSFEKEHIFHFANEYRTLPAVIIGRIAHLTEDNHQRKLISQYGWSEGLFKKVELV